MPTSPSSSAVAARADASGVATPAVDAPRFERTGALAPAEGLELLGELPGSGYKAGVCLVRRADGQMVQLGQLMFAALASADGRAGDEEIARRMSERLGRQVGEEHVRRLAEKLSAQGLLAGAEHQAPPKRNPLLALRWKVLVTDPRITRRLTAPLAVLFRPWILWPTLAAFVGVCWFVLVDKGIASATAQAFDKPELLLLVFALAVGSAGFHELGHAAACRYGGGTPGGIGVGLYLVWPAFYTDVTDAYRLPKRDRLRVDLGGLYFNAVVSVVTLAVWLAVRVDALLLLIGLQLLQMVKQLSPVIRADGYHILADATGVPDLFAHMGPTLRRLIPGRRPPSALTGRARLLVTAWVLVVVPVLLALTLSAVLLFPRLVATAWSSGSEIAGSIPGEVSHAQVLDVIASLLRLFALALPVAGTALVVQRIARTTLGKARDWSDGRPVRRFGLVAAVAGLTALMAWAWWPSGQYEAIRASDAGTITSLGRQISAPAAAARPQGSASVQLPPGRHLAMMMIPRGGATKEHPAVFVVRDPDGKREPVVIVTDHAPAVPKGADTLEPGETSGPSTTTAAGSPTASPTATPATATPPSSPTVPAAAFPFKLPTAPGPNDTQALAVNHTDGGTTYTVAYGLVTVRDGADVDETNSAFAFANCNACTTVAVSFQVVLVVGSSRVVAPVNAAGALNVDCPACTTLAVADQLVITLRAAPSDELMARLRADLQRLDAISTLGHDATPEQIAAQVSAVQQQIEDELNASGLPYHQVGPGTPSRTATTPTSTTPATTTAPARTTTTQTSPAPAPPATRTTTTSPAASTTAPTSTTPESAPPTTTTNTTPATSAPDTSSSGTPDPTTETSTTTTTTTPTSTAGTAPQTTTAPTSETP